MVKWKSQGTLANYVRCWVIWQGASIESSTRTNLTSIPWSFGYMSPLYYRARVSNSIMATVCSAPRQSADNPSEHSSCELCPNEKAYRLGGTEYSGRSLEIQIESENSVISTSYKVDEHSEPLPTETRVVRKFQVVDQIWSDTCHFNKELPT